MNYYNPETKEIFTEVILKYKGINVNDSNVLHVLNLFPIKYDYIEYNSSVDEMIPDSIEFNGEYYVQTFTTSELPESNLQNNLEKEAVDKANTARLKADEITAPYLSEFSNTEKLTFQQQELEVLAWQKDNSTPTPVLDSLAEVRGISRDEQIQKAITKVTLFRGLSATIIGQQQKYEDMIKEIKNNSEKTLRDRIIEIQNLEINYEIPNFN